MNGSRLALGMMLASLVAGCSHIPPVTPMPSEWRIATRQDCRPHADCDIDVNPHVPQWVPEEIIGRPGNRIHFKVRHLKFADPGIVFKTPEGVERFPCKRLNDRHIRCENNGAPNVQYWYGVRVVRPDGTEAPYDPFVWNR